jgi:hypothetical protein
MTGLIQMQNLRCPFLGALYCFFRQMNIFLHALYRKCWVGQIGIIICLVTSARLYIFILNFMNMDEQYETLRT